MSGKKTKIYRLYRVKFVPPPQVDFFSIAVEKEELLPKAIAEKPSTALRKGHVWRLGNVDDAGHLMGACAIGRTGVTDAEKFDARSGDFIIIPDEEGPSTHLLFLGKIGVVAIAQRSSLANDIQIAKALQGLLAATLVVSKTGLVVEVRQIPDPRDFLQRVEMAIKVTSFSASFRGPNPFDADDHFQRPLSSYAAAARAQNGEATIYGADLDREVVERVARSSAATGNSARARLSEESRRGSHWVRMGDEAALVEVPADASTSQALKLVANRYQEIRHGSRD